MTSFGLSEVRIRGYRSLLDVAIRPGRVTALVGEANAGKSNVLAAIRALMDPGAPAPTVSDASVEGDGDIHIEAELGDGKRVSLSGTPPRLVAEREGIPPAVFLPTALRTGQVVAASKSADGGQAGAAHLLRQAVRELGSHRHGPSDTAAARALVAGIESCREAEQGGALILIEEPELFLGPHTQRYLYRLLQGFAAGGNQVMYSTRTGLPERRPSRGVRPRRTAGGRRHQDRPAGAPRPWGGVPCDERVRRGAERAVPVAGRHPRRGSDRAAHVPLHLPCPRP